MLKMFFWPGGGLWHRLLLSLLPFALLAGCASFVANYDPAARDRIVSISEDILGLYQTLLSTPPAERRAKVVALQPTYDEIETELRVATLLEGARPNNEDSQRILKDLTDNFSEVRASHQSGNPDALANATLLIERGTFERILTAAVKAEDAKKLANVTSGGSS